MNEGTPKPEGNFRPIEPPVTITSQGLDAWPPRTGHARTDMIIAGCAIFISLLSLLIAFNQTRMMRQQVAASSWPLLQYSTGNTDEKNSKLAISMAVQNAGVGPAIVKRFDIYYRDRRYTNIFKLLADCCGYQIKTVDPTVVPPGTPLTFPVTNTIIRPGESTTFFQMGLSRANKDSWVLLDKARFELKFDACYCSVIGECWRSNLRDIEPEPARSCAVEGPKPAHSS